MRCGLPWRREWKTQITLFIYGTIHHWLLAQRNTISLAVLESQTFDCEYKDVEKYNNKIKCKANDEQHKEKRNVQQIHYYHSCESIVRRVGFACYLILFAMMTVCRWSERQRRRCSEVVRQMNGFAHHAVEWWDERIATEHNDVILCYVFAILNCIEFIWVGTVQLRHNLDLKVFGIKTKYMFTFTDQLISIILIVALDIFNRNQFRISALRRAVATQFQ